MMSWKIPSLLGCCSTESLFRSLQYFGNKFTQHQTDLTVSSRSFSLPGPVSGKAEKESFPCLHSWSSDLCAFYSPARSESVACAQKYIKRAREQRTFGSPRWHSGRVKTVLSRSALCSAQVVGCRRRTTCPSTIPELPIIIVLSLSLCTIVANLFSFLLSFPGHGRQTQIRIDRRILLNPKVHFAFRSVCCSFYRECWPKVIQFKQFGSPPIASQLCYVSEFKAWKREKTLRKDFTNQESESGQIKFSFCTQIAENELVK